jgi:hypothetical protein
VGNHVVLTICAPIAIVETFVASERRHLPWLRRPGLAVTAALFVLGCLIVHSDTSDGFAAGPLQRPVAVSVVVALVAAALVHASRARRRREHAVSARRAPRPLWIVLVVSVTRLADDQAPDWWGLALMAGAFTVAGGLILWWSRRPGWGQGHVLAAGSTSLALSAVLAWVVPTYEPASTVASVTGDLAVTVIALALVGGAWWRLRSVDRAPRPRVIPAT